MQIDVLEGDIILSNSPGQWKQLLEDRCQEVLGKADVATFAAVTPSMLETL